ncbi:MAG: hypothetical protein RJA27_1140, partial [Pseudomonadota bacterium]
GKWINFLIFNFRIQKIILFCDYGCFPTLSDERIEIIEVTKRPTYLDFFTT